MDIDRHHDPVLEPGVSPDLPEQPLPEAIAQTGPESTAWVIRFLPAGRYSVGHRGTYAPPSRCPVSG